MRGGHQLGWQAKSHPRLAPFRSPVAMRSQVVLQSPSLTAANKAAMSHQREDQGGHQLGGQAGSRPWLAPFRSPVAMRSLASQSTREAQQC